MNGDRGLSRNEECRVDHPALEAFGGALEAVDVDRSEVAARFGETHRLENTLRHQPRAAALPTENETFSSQEFRGRTADAFHVITCVSHDDVHHVAVEAGENSQAATLILVVA